MRKLLLCIVFVSTLLLVGCSGESKKNEEPVTITLWHYYNDDIKAQFDELVRLFNETVGLEKGIIVDAYSQGGVNELADALYASAQEDIGSSPMPDLFAAYSDSAFRLDQLGVVASLDDYFTEEELARYRPEFLEDGRFADDASLKIVPIAKSTELLFINMTAFEEFSAATGASLDALQTWEGLADTAQKYYEWSGSAFFGIDSMSNFMIQAAKQLGEDIVTVEHGKGSFHFSEETARKIWDSFYVPYMKGYYSSGGRFRSDDVKSGMIAAFVGASSSASYFPKTIETGKDTGYSTESFVMPYPHFEGKGKNSVQQGAGMVVAKSTQNKERACVEFLKWFTSPEQNVQFTAATSYMPVEQEALTYDQTIEAMNIDDKGDVRVQTADALYKMLKDYTLYASKPFEQSLEVRDVLNTSLSDFIQADQQALQDREKGGENIEELYEEYTGETNFRKWYTELTAAVTAHL